MLLFSSDCHAGATAPVYRQFMDRQFHDEFDRWLGQRAEAYAKQYSTEAPRASRKAGAQGDDKPQAAAPGSDQEARAIFGTNLDQRLARLEDDGVVGEVLFPGPNAGPGYEEYGIPFSGMLFSGGAGDSSFELLAAGYRAHNRWQAATLDRDRQVGLAMISLHDVDAAVMDARAARDEGLRGVLLDGVHPDLPPLHDKSYDPFWSTCEDLGLPVHWHATAGLVGMNRVTGPMSDGRRVVLSEPVGIMDMPFFHRRPLWYMIAGGVLARHPRLRIVFTEMGARWSVDAVTAMDHHWGFFPGRRGVDAATGEVVCPEPPSAYYDKQVAFGFSNVSWEEVKTRHDVGVRKLMWGSDHPHGGGGWGVCDAWIRATFGAEGVSEEDARAILGENAVAFYGLDPDKLRSIADRVGPLAKDLLREPDPSDLEEPVVQRFRNHPPY